MIAAVFMAAAVALLAGFALLRKQYLPVLADPGARRLLNSALVLMGALAAFWVVFGVGEMASGDVSGASHLVPAAIIVLLIFAARRRPLEGGVVFLVLGGVLSIYMMRPLRPAWSAHVGAALITGGPFILIGALLLSAAVKARRAARSSGTTRT